MSINDDPDFRSVPVSHPQHEFVLLLVLQDLDTGLRYFVGSAVMIGDGIAISARHIIDQIRGHIVRLRRDPLDEILYGHDIHFHLPHGLGLDAIQICDQVENIHRRWSVTGLMHARERDLDLLLLRLAPHPRCPSASSYEITPPVFQPFSPAVGQEVVAYGWPDIDGIGFDPIQENDPTRIQLFESRGTVTEIFPRGAGRIVGFSAALRTESGMSGGAVLTSKPPDGQNVFCGIICLASN